MDYTDVKVKDKIKGLINSVYSDITIAQNNEMAIKSLRNLEEFLGLRDYKYKGIWLFESEG